MTEELQFLRRQFERGDVVLFAGAGFSHDAKNRLGNAPPLGSDLARLLCSECGWGFEGDSLSEIYDQAQRHLGTERLRTLLEKYYAHCEPAEWHLMIPQICWYRIYTTNIDDVLQATYKKVPAQQSLRTIINPAPLPEADPFLEEVACIHLHGSVEDHSKPFLFGVEDFAELSATSNPLYQALLDDMSSRSVLFIGSQLN